MPASAFLTIYQSVLCNIPAACCFIVLINFVFKPSTFTSPSVPKPSVSSCAVNKLSACALAVAVPHDLVTLPLPNAYDSLVLIYHFSSLKFVLSVSTS